MFQKFCIFLFLDLNNIEKLCSSVKIWHICFCFCFVFVFPTNARVDDVSRQTEINLKKSEAIFHQILTLPDKNPS